MKSVSHMPLDLAGGETVSIESRLREPAAAPAVRPPAGADDPLLAEGTPIDDFRIRGFLGEGAMGQVYLAQDLRLGRQVALKLIKRSHMRGPDAVERFLAEARATATFNHPHIVTIHAAGEHDGRPYLALEYIEGESLRARIKSGPLPVRAALRCTRAIAEAIAEAHRRGLVHADLKPENVVIPQDGRVRLVDFGVARLAGSPTEGVSGTPVYMAPERWRNEPPTGAIDVWALGVVLHELITGRRPLADDALVRLTFSKEPLARLSLPAAPWASIVRDCLAYDPAARPTADELVGRIAALLDPRAVSTDPARCPFPGLAPFSREHAGDYFGRRAELDGIVEQLRTRALVPVVGPSGIGKSSFVHAALVPRLEEAERWIAISLRPGPSPFASLAASLVLPGHSALVLTESLRRHPDSLSLVLGEVARHHDARVLLVVDQLEEAFTLASDPAEALAFCECLARAGLPAEPWRIVLTLRDDFLGRLAAAPAMRPHLGAVMHLGPLFQEDLHAAVAGPLDHAGYQADTPELIERIVADVANQAACLPLLQFTCRALWERRDVVARCISTDQYKAMGGATGALASHAERLLAELTPGEVRLVRGLLLSLVHPDGPRRPRRRGELLDALPEASRDTADRLLDRLLERRLLVSTRDTDEGTTTLELAHEALAAAWPRLARWIDETREERVLAVELEQAGKLWQRRGRSDAETWSGAALAEAARKVGEWSIHLSPVGSAFLDASVARDRAAQRRRRRIVSGVIAALALVATGAGVAAVTIARKSEALDVAARDLGRIQLTLTPFDWDPEQQRRLAPKVRPPLEWRLYQPSKEDATEPGHPYDAENVRRGTPAWRGDALVEDVEVRSGPAFLEIRGRGGDCAPSLIYLQRLPGYGERAELKPIEIAVPTCQASQAGMVEIPAGPFLRAVKRSDRTTYDEEATLPTYSIDRTEVTRGAFATFADIKHLTGFTIPTTEWLIKSNKTFPPGTISGRQVPISGINFATARSYCRYMGKALPTMDQWQKALRGGIQLKNGTSNPAPTRDTPQDKPFQLVLDIAPAGANPIDVSPYGVFDLAGNVSEWSRDLSLNYEGLRRVLGGNWDPPPGKEYARIHDTNARTEGETDFGIGVRCVNPGLTSP